MVEIKDSTEKIRDGPRDLILLECIICTSTNLFSNSSKVDLVCSCNVCRDCVSFYIKERISNGLAMMPCPNYECNTTISDAIIKKLVNDDVFKKLQTLKNENFMANSSTLMWCPTIDCDTLLRRSKYYRISENKIKCLKCKRKFEKRVLLDDEKWLK